MPLVPVDHDPFETLTPVDYDPFAAEKFANPAVQGAITSLATLPQRAIQNSQYALDTGNYDPGPTLEAATLPMGTGAIAGVPVRAGEAVLGSGAVRGVKSAAMNEPEKVVTAAIKNGNQIYTGPIHTDAIEEAARKLGVSPESIMSHENKWDLGGFLTTKGRYVSREEANNIAEAHNQIDKTAPGYMPGNKLAGETLKTEDDPEFYTKAFTNLERVNKVAASDAKNTATLNGRPFWSGAFDPIDGHIIETHPYARAERNDFHHSTYFSPKAIEAMKNGDAHFFWLDQNGKVQTGWRESAAKPEIIQAIEGQIAPSAFAEANSATIAAEYQRRFIPVDHDPFAESN